MLTRRRLSLTWLLAIATACELLLHRIVMRLVERQPLGTASSWKLIQVAAELGGQFALHFTGVLSLALCLWGLYEVAHSRGLFALPARITVATIGTITIAIAGVGIFTPLQGNVHLARDLAFFALLAALLLTVLTHPGPTLRKLAIAYLSGILLLRSGWLLEQQSAALLQWPPQLNGWTTRIYGLSDHLIAASGVVVLACYAPLARWRSLLRPLPLAIGFTTTILATFLVVSEYPLAELVAQRGFNLQLPHPASPALALHLLSIFPFTVTLVALFSASPMAAGTGIGLLLIALSGFHLIASQQLLLTLVGLLQLARAARVEQLPAVRATQPADIVPSADQWRAYLRRVATGCMDPDAPNEAIVLQDGHEEIARVRCMLGGIPYAVRLAIRQGELEELEIDVGQPPKDGPQATIVRRRRSRGQRIRGGRGPKVRAFDERFELRDRTGQIARLLQPLEDLLARDIHGWLGIWPAEGLRYVCRPAERDWPIPVGRIAQSSAEAEVQDLQQLVRLLIQVAQQVDVHG